MAIIDYIKIVGALATSLVAAIGLMKIIIALRYPLKSFFYWVIDRIMRNYVENITQQKLDERLSNLAKLLVEEDIVKLKEIRDKTIQGAAVWHQLHDPVFVKLKSLGLVNESFDYYQSNLRLKAALQNPSLCLKYRVGTLSDFLQDLDMNMALYQDDENQYKISYRTHDSITHILLKDFCEKIEYDINNIDLTHSSLSKLENHVNQNINMSQIFPLCIQSSTIDNLLWVIVYLTSDGLSLLSSIEEIEKNNKATNYKNLNVSTKAKNVLIEKYSK